MLNLKMGSFHVKRAHWLCYPGCILQLTLVDANLLQTGVAQASAGKEERQTLDLTVVEAARATAG